jgi:cytosine/adenosine deaminase-related metal-dependent hydrolase
MISDSSIVLNNLELLNGEFASINIAGQGITSLSSVHTPMTGKEIRIYFQDCIAFPGLINSHDHLEFNLFPQLGGKVYDDYLEWGPDIHLHSNDLVNSVLQVPKQLRVQWGLYKNLLNGITTVVHHGAPAHMINPLIDVFGHCYSLHSVRLEHYWKLKLNNPFLRNWPFAIHVGEGTSKAARDEVDELLRWNIFKRRLIGIHAVAMSEEQARNFEAVVWCPDSNFFLLGKTAAIDNLRHVTSILFGTDSTISSHWSIWHHLRLARHTGALSDEELIAAVLTNASKVWKLSTGTLKKGYAADVVVGRKKDSCSTAIDNFFDLNPEDLMLIISKGRIVLFDESLKPQLTHLSLRDYTHISINDVRKFVAGDVAGLIRNIRKYWKAALFPIETE